VTDKKLLDQPAVCCPTLLDSGLRISKTSDLIWWGGFCVGVKFEVLTVAVNMEKRHRVVWYQEEPVDMYTRLHGGTPQTLSQREHGACLSIRCCFVTQLSVQTDLCTACRRSAVLH
jgi:hypothetical protein